MSRIDWKKQQVRDKRARERQDPPRPNLGPKRRVLSATPQSTGFSFGRPRAALLLELECGHRVLFSYLPQGDTVACGKCQDEGKP